jgi:hypothetical protein
MVENITLNCIVSVSERNLGLEIAAIEMPFLPINFESLLGGTESEYIGRILLLNQLFCAILDRETDQSFDF